MRRAGAVCALAIVLTSSIAEGQSSSRFRSWTDGETGQQAVAAFVEVKDRWVVLRREDGRLAQAEINRLSADDRQFLKQLAGLETRSAAGPTTIGNLLGSLSKTIRYASGLLSTSWLPSRGSEAIPESKTAAAEDQIHPARLALVKISRELLADNIERDVVKKEYVRDVIVSLPIEGPAFTRGTTTVQLVPSANNGVLDILLHGVCDTDTAGSTRGVTIQSHATTHFAARKRLYLSPAGLKTMPTVSSARAEIRTTGIDTSLPRLRGRIATRIASRRVSDSRGQAKRETARHAELRINTVLDDQVEGLLSSVRPHIQRTLTELAAIQRETGYRIRYSTSPLHLLVSVEDPQGDSSAALPVLADDRPIAIQIHQSLLKQAVTNLRLRNLASKWMGKSSPTGRLVSARSPDMQVHTRWSPDGNWLTVHWSSDEPAERLARQ
jgi:hypothetical protein